MTVWLVIAALVGLLVGRMIRRRDQQVPQDSPSIVGPHLRTRRTPDPTPDAYRLGGPSSRRPQPRDSEQRPPG